MMGERLRKQPKSNQSEASSTDELTRPRTAPRWDAQGAPTRHTAAQAAPSSMGLMSTHRAVLLRGTAAY